MRVLLTTLNSKFIHTNLAIRYIHSYSKALFDSLDDKYELFIQEYTINNSVDYILKKIVSLNVDIVAFSVYIWNVDDIARLSKNIKLVRPDIKIIWGGPEVSYDVEHQMKSYEFVDYIIYGEGEKSFFELIKSIIYDSNISEVLGVAYRDGKNIIINDEMPLIENLDDIPSPFLNMRDDEYKNKIVYYESSRGCPFNCQYCLSSAIKGLRFFSIERVKSDLRILLDADVAQIKFIDRTFNANKPMAKEVMRFLMENDNGHTTFHFEVTAHLIDDDMLEFLKDAKPGLFQFEIGVQSTNIDTLTAVGRVEDFDRLSKVVKKVSSYKNIHQHLDLIAGLPFEGYKRFSKSFDEVYSLKSECLQLGFLKMIKGTGIRKNSDVHGYVFRDYPPYEILSNKYMSFDEISKLKDIEEVLEIYYNSGNFRMSVDFVVDSLYESPFKFYEELSDYFDANGYFDIALGRDKLFEAFYGFFEKICDDENLKDIFLEILKFDYISLGRPNSIPTFMNRYTMDNFKDRCHKFLQIEENQRVYTPNHYRTPAKNIVKYTHFEVFKYNILELDAGKFPAPSKVVIMFYYDIDKTFEKSKASIVAI